MFTSLTALLALAGTALDSQSGYLFKISAGPDRSIRFQGERYQPQPGDILLFDDHNRISAKAYHTLGTGGPLHAGIVYRKPDGALASLEAGTDGVMKVFNHDLKTRLRGFDGTLLVRRLRKPITPEQSQQLAEFAAAQEGKPYALGRLALQTIPLRLRTARYSRPFGRTVVDRDRWFCSEIVVAAAVVAGIWPLDAYPANMMYPRDLCYDEHFDLSPHHEPPALWYPRAELERVGAGVRVNPR
jgi:hypothetical protein